VYSIFLATIHRQASLWPVVVVQALIVAHLLYISVRVTLGIVRPTMFVGLIGLLGLLTSLPWLVGQIMPDVFAGLVILATFALGFGRLGRLEAGYVAVLGALAIAAHYSHVVLAAGLISVIFVWRMARRPKGAVATPAPALLLAPLLLAGLAIALTNLAYRGTLSSPAGPTLLLARTLADGPARAYLEESCPTVRYALCEYLDELPSTSDDLLWRAESPLYRAGGIEALASESRAIVWRSWQADPVWHLQWAIRNTGRQLALFDTGDGLGPYTEADDDDRRATPLVIKEYFPAVYAGYVRSRQNTGQLHLEAIRPLHTVAVAASVLASVPILVILARRRQHGPVALAGVILVGVILNATITGAVSNPIPRYESRVIWLVGFWTLLGLWAVTRRGRRPRPWRVTA
jgi:hypothetical protein